MRVNWKKIELQELCDVRDGTHDSPKYYDNGIPFITSKNLSERGVNFEDISYISEQDHKKFSARSNVENGDILFGMIGTVGKPVIVNVDFEFSIKNVALLKFQKSDKLLNQFALNVLKSSIIEEQFSRKSDGGVQSFVSLSTIRKLEFPVPPLPQQQKIAKILSTCDEVLEKTEAAIAKYQAIKQGMMHDLFTRGIDMETGKLRQKYEDAPELYQESELGWIPKEWEISNFEEATEIITDFTANGSFESLRVNVKYYYERNYGRLIRLTDLRQGLENDGVYVDKSGFEYLKKSELQENDIMLANVGEYTGYACLMPKVNYPATIAPNMFLVRCDNSLFDSKFMYYYMTYKAFTNQVDNVSASSATKLLNKTNFRAMNILKPSKKEQCLISKKLSTLDRKIESEQASLFKCKKIKAGLMQDLLSGKVEVKVEEDTI